MYVGTLTNLEIAVKDKMWELTNRGFTSSSTLEYDKL